MPCYAVTHSLHCVNSAKICVPPTPTVSGFLFGRVCVLLTLLIDSAKMFLPIWQRKESVTLTQLLNLPVPDACSDAADAIGI